MKRYVTFNTGDTTYHLGIRHANPSILSGGSPGRIRKIAKYLENTELIESDRGLVTVHGTYKGMPITAFSTGMGPASVSITLPEIIEACDDPNMIILRLGTSGGIKRHLNIGDLVITTDVLRFENTSDKIMGPNYHAESDKDVREALQNAAEKNKASFQKVYVGQTAVTNDIYFHALDTKEEDYGDALAIAMEFSVYCALRDRYNRDYDKKIKVGNLLTVSDAIFGEHENFDVKEFESKKTEIEDAHIKIGLETLRMMRNG